MITDTQVAVVNDYLIKHGTSEAVIATLRPTLKPAHLTYCLDDDIQFNAKPYLEGNGYNIYLVNSESHCSVLTNDAEKASGLVVAEVIEDE